jgi:peptide/nickel transport system substrate-binding protein
MNRLFPRYRRSSRRGFLAGSAALVGATLLPARAGRARLAAQDPQPGGGLVIASVTGEPDVLDPHVTAWGGASSLLNNIFDPLVWADARDNSFKPGLAESWEVSDNATAYTFTLREGVTFHDGTPFNAEAVKFSYDRIADPETVSQLARSLLGPYDSTEVVDELTATVRFTDPYAAFLDAASRANLGIVSPTAVEELGEDFGRNPVGTGYFRFQEWVPNQHITLERNEEYNWASPLFSHEGPTYLDWISYRVVPEEATALASFDNGELQVMTLPYRELERYESNPEFSVVTFTYRGFPSSYLINTERPPTDDLRVRQAIMHAVSPEFVAQISFAGVPKPAHTPLNSPSLGYNPDLATMYPLDPARAGQLLDEAGWTMGGDGIRVKDGEPLRLTFIGSAGWEPYAEPVQPMLREVGIDMELRILTAAARSEANINGEHHLAGLGFSNSDPSVLTNIFHSDNIASGFAWSRYRSEELDQLLEEAQGESDVDTRIDLYHQVQQIIMDNALCRPLIEGASIVAFPSHVHDITLDTRGFPYYFDAWTEQTG